jgi:thiamine biosynthesis lipoprotein
MERVVEERIPAPWSVAPHADAMRFTHGAMATTFELLILGEDARYAAQAAAATFDLIDRLEQELSRYLPDADVARINRQAPGEALRIGLAATECLELSVRVSAATGGAFDVTVGRLVDLWKRGTPAAERLAEARAATGMRLLALDAAAHTLTVGAHGIAVDLGGVGKGHAVDAATALLRDWGIAHALVNGGGSSLATTGAPPGAKGWPLTFSHPANAERELGALALAEGGVSGSGLGKGPHIIDPRTGAPVTHTIAAWVTATTALEADALSTAFMVMTPVEVERFCAHRPEIRAMLVAHAAGGGAIRRFGQW